MTSQVNTYERLFENAVEGIFQTLPDGKYLRVNPALARIYGYGSPDELMRDLTNIAEQLYVDKGRRDDFMTAIEKNDVVQDFESRVRQRDGSIRWISENARAVRDLSGQLQYYEGFVIDITDRKEAEARQAAMETELNHAHTMTALGHLAGGVAHDFKTLLTLVEILTERALGECEAGTSPRIRENLAQISAVVERGSKVVERIRRVSELSNTEAEPVCVDRTVSDVIRLLRVSLPEGVEIVPQLELDLKPVVANPVTLFQLFMNMVTTVLRSKDGEAGRIPVKLGYATTEHAIREGLPRDSYVRFTVGEQFEMTTANPVEPVDESVRIGLRSIETTAEAIGGRLIVHECKGEPCGFELYLPTTDERQETDDLLSQFSTQITSQSGAA